jgi:glycosyltransferase involved in cell wall biosynthesis
VIYDVPEDMPRDVLNRPWLARWARRPVAYLVAAAEWTAGRWFDAVVPATPIIARRFPSQKAVLVQNFPDLNEFRGSLHSADVSGRDARTNLAHSPLRFVYVGTCVEERGIRTMIGALELLGSDVAVKLVLAGEFSPPTLLEEVQQMAGWKRVRFLGWQDRRSVGRLLSESFAGLAILQPNRATREGQSTKVFEYMAAGLPVITSDFPVWRRFVQATGSGLLVDPLSRASVAEAIERLATNPADAVAMGRRGREAIERDLNWTAEGARLVGLYDRITGRERRQETCEYQL